MTGLLCMGSIVATTKASHAAIVDDVPACRCLADLSFADVDGIPEEVRRDAARIVDDYCEEDRSLDNLSGADRGLADQSCLLLHTGFEVELIEVEESDSSASVEIRLKVQVGYQGHRVQTNFFTDWRHNVAIHGGLSFTFWPARAHHQRDDYVD